MLRASVGSAARAAGRLPSGALPQGSSLLWSVLEQCLRQQAEALFEEHSYKAAARDAMAQVGDLLDTPNILPCDAKCPGIAFGRHNFRGFHIKGIVGWLSRPIVLVMACAGVKEPEGGRGADSQGAEVHAGHEGSRQEERGRRGGGSTAARGSAGGAAPEVCHRSQIASTLNVRPVFRYPF